MGNKKVLYTANNGDVSKFLEDKLRESGHLVDVTYKKETEVMYYLNQGNYVDLIVADGESLSKKGVGLLEDLRKDELTTWVHLIADKGTAQFPPFDITRFPNLKSCSPLNDLKATASKVENLLSEPELNKYGVTIIGPGNIGEAVAGRLSSEGIIDRNEKKHTLDRLFLYHRRQERVDSLKSNLISDNIDFDIITTSNPEDLGRAVKNSSVYIVTLGYGESETTSRNDLIGRYYEDFFNIFDRMRDAKGTMLIVTNRPTENVTLMHMLSHHYTGGELRVEGSNIVDYKRAITLLLREDIKKCFPEYVTSKINKVDVDVFGDHGSEEMVMSGIRITGELPIMSRSIFGCSEEDMLSTLEKETVDYGLKEIRENKMEALTQACTLGIIEQVRAILFDLPIRTAIIPIDLYDIRPEYFKSEDSLPPIIAMGWPVIRKGGVGYPSSDASDRLNNKRFERLVTFANNESDRIKAQIERYDGSRFQDYYEQIKKGLKPRPIPTH